MTPSFFLVWMAGHVILPLTRPMYMRKGISLENRKGIRTSKDNAFSMGTLPVPVLGSVVSLWNSHAEVLPPVQQYVACFGIEILAYSQVEMKSWGWALILHDCARVRGSNLDTDVTHKRQTCTQEDTTLGRRLRLERRIRRPRSWKRGPGQIIPSPPDGE